ncbi:hypothetical protein Bfae_14320 [Brachybacterium faecium DSM 4810]|uniref:DUF4192 family protein n=1 Tax=Brachybacterium faecium (strain ATCC 43885 / DSM 4810 / JCM 11609 / LMG 19847 / NBRC 14762 / NCIMB 9860 / 6-10) TaxID=446465 RepID=C7MCF6_BRAFD|nr:hypothetical protein [Brachybacterium faecium]ACU85263.1 hypothetical protein Bfae_14320 [Brachybacterium faecium DSM 4810]
MTTNTTPADHGRHLLSGDDAAELLAESRLCLREIPTDCLILAGSGSAGTPAMITRSSLRDLLGPRGGENLEHHLALMGDRGSGDLRALIVVGDGYQDLLAPVVEGILRRAGAVVHRAARALEGGPPAVLAVHGAASSTCWTVPPPAAGGAAGIRPVDAGPLRDFADTSAAASAVLLGRPIPRAELFSARLEEIGRLLELPAPDLASTEDPGRLFATARAALEPLLVHGEVLTGQDTMTKCEQVAALLSALAVDRLHWELLAQCVERGGRGRIDRETLLQILVRDGEWAPHPDICAGGEWYDALLRFRAIADSAQRRGAPAARSIARSSWRALTALLVLLAWWNHRFATAGELVDELWDREPESTLAPLLSRMTDTPIFPAWWPST